MTAVHSIFGTASQLNMVAHEGTLAWSCKIWVWSFNS